MSPRFVGLLSGTSMDAVDAALVEFDGDAPRLLAHHDLPYPDDLRQELAALARPGAADGDALDRLGTADIALGRWFARAVAELLADAGVPADSVTAIGSHGQTVRHRPEGPHPFSLQIGDPNVIAQATGITTVADFRRRDLAAGGQGAPLAPAFHAAVFRHAGEDRAVLNLGGIANLTTLPAGPDGPVLGFDTGPANTLLDAWAQRHLGRPRDDAGAWGASGTVDPTLLARLRGDGYFSRRAPKSTGPEHFHLDWLTERLAGSEAPADVQATLQALTATTVADALQDALPGAKRLLVCGGGVHNDAVMARLAEAGAPVAVESTAAYGVDPDWVEAAAFAWLARATLAGRPGNLPAVTGAAAPVVLGGVYPGQAPTGFQPS
ncbi:MAG TPA: anhydro-N-acetylmuramic acid kinase [Gammaproteobacteria bacterium]|nr:anhydro-N-acetylmuramic acid kinase [Gammaproteobacteria bacterium]